MKQRVMRTLLNGAQKIAILDHVGQWSGTNSRFAIQVILEERGLKKTRCSAKSS